MNTTSLPHAYDFLLTDLKEPVRILYLTANPLDTSHLPLKAEFDAIRISLERFLRNEQYILEHEWEVDPRHLLVRLLKVRPHIIHFGGHGTPDGELLATDNTNGLAIAIRGEALGDLLAPLVPTLRLVVLNACWSNLHATLLTKQAGIPFVIGMHSTVENQVAETFVTSFYNALTSGESVRQSFRLAQAALALAHMPSDAPQLAEGTAPVHNPSHVEQKGIEQYLNGLELNYLQELTKYIDLLGEQTSLNPRPLHFRSMINEAEQYLRVAQLEADYFPASSQTPTVVTSVRNQLLRIPRCVLIGGPGSGKTWTLWRLVSDYIARYRESARGARTLVPLWLSLSEYQDQSSFSAFVYEQTSLLETQLDPLQAVNQVIFICDGFNELGPERMATVRGFLQDKPYFVVTCRDDEYQRYFNSVPSLERLCLRPLTLHQIKALFLAYLSTRGNDLWTQLQGNETLLSAFDKLVTHTSAEIFWEGNQSAPSFLAPQEDDAWRTMLEDPTQLLKLCRNPFLASILCAIYAQHQQLPSNAAMLFGTFVSLLYHREADRVVRSGNNTFPELQILEQFLEEIAAILQKSDTTVLRRDQLLEGVRPHFDTHQVEGLLNSAFATALLEVAHIQGAGIRFTHQLLQEFFAARTLRRAFIQGQSAAQFFGKEWWQLGTWRVAFGLLGQMLLLKEPDAINGGAMSSLQRVVQWVAPVSPEVALDIYQGDGTNVEPLERSTRQILLNSAIAKTNAEAYLHPAARASAYQTLGKLHADSRPGVLLRPDGLPDITWCQIEQGRFGYQNQTTILPYTFYMGRYPVTSAQYGAFRNASDYRDPQWWKFLELPRITLQQLPLSNLPFYDMSWWEAVALARWLNHHMRERAGQVLQSETLLPLDRLVWEGVREGLLHVCVPRDEEWEKCARGIHGKIYPWGYRYKTGRANIDETKSSQKLEWQGVYNLQRPTPVGIYPRNVSPYGASDMVGNIWEWTTTPYKAGSEWDPTRGQVLHRWRIARGGSFGSHYREATLVYQGKLDPRLRVSDKGLRLCASPSPYLFV